MDAAPAAADAANAVDRATGRHAAGRPGATAPISAATATTVAVVVIVVALAAVAGGTILRLWNLDAQILGGDELHAVRAALAQPLGALLTTYQLADSCIPLTALDRLWIDHGQALDEWVLRLPVLACGLAALVLMPLAARRRLPAAALPFFAALVALSPLLVLYSRIARSYMPATLLSFAAAMAFDSWWRLESGAGRGRAGAAVSYVLLGAAAMWFHLGTAPMIAAPLAFAALDWLVARHVAGRRPATPDDAAQGGGSPRRPFWQLLTMGAALAVACAVFLVPALPSLRRLVAAKHQAQSVPAAIWWDVLRLQAGTRDILPAFAFWLAAAAGAAALVRWRRRLGWYLVALAAAQPLGILLLSPLGLARVQVLDRYLLPALPIVLIWVAAGLALPWWPRHDSADRDDRDGRVERAGRPGRVDPAGRAAYAVQLTTACACVAWWLAAGPFAGAAYRGSSFMHHNDFVAFVEPRATLPPGALPAPYRLLPASPHADAAADGAAAALVELPWPPAWDFGRSFYAYQEIHRHRVLVSPLAGALPADPARLRLRNALPPTAPTSLTAPLAAALLASGTGWVMVHRHLAVEEARLRTASGAPPPRPIPPALAAELAAEGAAAAAALTAAWGPPLAADADVALWRLPHTDPSGTLPRASRTGPLPRAARTKTL